MSNDVRTIGKAFFRVWYQSMGFNRNANIALNVVERFGINRLRISYLCVCVCVSIHKSVPPDVAALAIYVLRTNRPERTLCWRVFRF